MSSSPGEQMDRASATLEGRAAGRGTLRELDAREAGRLDLRGQRHPHRRAIVAAQPRPPPLAVQARPRLRPLLLHHVDALVQQHLSGCQMVAKWWLLPGGPATEEMLRPRGPAAGP